MITEAITAARDLLLKIPTALLVALAVVAIAVLWMPAEYAMKLGIETLREDLRPYFGIGFLTLVAMVIARIFGALGKQIRYWKQRRVNRQRLETLSPDEKGYLIPFVYDGKATISVDVADGVAGSLYQKGVLYRQSNVFYQLDGVPYGIQPWALDYLRSHPHLLEDAVGRPMTPREKSGFR